MDFSKLNLPLFDLPLFSVLPMETINKICVTSAKWQFITVYYTELGELIAGHRSQAGKRDMNSAFTVMSTGIALYSTSASSFFTIIVLTPERLALVNSICVLDTMQLLEDNGKITHSWNVTSAGGFLLQYMQKKVCNLSILDEAVKGNKLTHIFVFLTLYPRDHGRLKTTWNPHAKQYFQRFADIHVALNHCLYTKSVCKRSERRFVFAARMFKSRDKNFKNVATK